MRDAAEDADEGVPAAEQMDVDVQHGDAQAAEQQGAEQQGDEQQGDDEWDEQGDGDEELGEGEGIAD